ncbi:butyrate kinase [Candidatus Dojkabacteria bacterium]|nr:butyrate kinase [Candidatus Dojkabacteria bacterium]
MRVLVINPGSTSTKLAVFDDEELFLSDKIDYSENKEFIEKYSTSTNIFDQLDDRRTDVKTFLKLNDITELDAIVGRGGMMQPVKPGTYRISHKMMEDLCERPLADHASNLGAELAYEIAKEFSIEEAAFIVDPVTADEMLDHNRFTGLPQIRRYAAWHALNQRAIARRYAADMGKKVSDINLIVAHIGGGASFGAHKKGRVVNVTNALSGEGGFTPERAGALPAQGVIELCFSGEFTKEELLKMIAGNGGLYAHTGDKHVENFSRKFDKLSQPHKDVFVAMLKSITRTICSLIPDFDGEPVDQVLITGGVANETFVMEFIRKDLSAIGLGVTVYPSELELGAMRDGALRVLRGEETALSY